MFLVSFELLLRFWHSRSCHCLILILSILSQHSGNVAMSALVRSIRSLTTTMMKTNATNDDFLLRLPSILVTSVITPYMNSDDGWNATCVSRGWYGIWCSFASLWNGPWNMSFTSNQLPRGLRIILTDDRDIKSALPHHPPSTSISSTSSSLTQPSLSSTPLSPPSTSTTSSSSSSSTTISRPILASSLPRGGAQLTTSYPWRSCLSKRARMAYAMSSTKHDVLPRSLTLSSLSGRQGHDPYGELRIGVYGDGGVGKSSLVLRFIADQFIEDYDPTIEDSYRAQMLIVETKTLPKLSSLPSTPVDEYGGRHNELPYSYDQLRTLEYGEANGEMRLLYLDVLDTAAREEYMAMRNFRYDNNLAIICVNPTVTYSWEYARDLHQQIVCFPLRPSLILHHHY
jgi:hypothetical protein